MNWLAMMRQRSAGAVDLVVAATADEQGLMLLHDDKDFECVARVTGQPLARIDIASAHDGSRKEEGSEKPGTRATGSPETQSGEDDGAAAV